jgi:hypothetical protein
VSYVDYGCEYVFITYSRSVFSIEKKVLLLLKCLHDIFQLLTTIVLVVVLPVTNLMSLTVSTALLVLVVELYLPQQVHLRGVPTVKQEKLYVYVVKLMTTVVLGKYILF